MTAGELPPSKARPSVRGGKDSGAAGHGWKRRQDRRATVERGKERAGPGRARADEHLLPGPEYAVAGVRQIASYRLRGAGSSIGGPA